MNIIEMPTLNKSSLSKLSNTALSNDPYTNNAIRRYNSQISLAAKLKDFLQQGNNLDGIEEKLLNNIKFQLTQNYLNIKSFLSTNGKKLEIQDILALKNDNIDRIKQICDLIIEGNTNVIQNIVNRPKPQKKFIIKK